MGRGRYGRMANHELRAELAARGTSLPPSATRAELLMALAKEPDSKMGNSTHPRKTHKWTEKDVALIQSHPDWTAAELAALLGVTTRSVDYARRRFGRFPSNAVRLCVACDQRPVYVESREAKRLGLCKGCWLKEQRRRLEEDAESTRLRQAKHRKST